MNATPPAVKRRACVACTAAKAKCTPQTANQCQRCVRLGKSCAYLDLPQTRRKPKAAPSRVEVLEKKVDQLMAQLAALTQQNRQISPNTSNPSLTNDLDSSGDPRQDSTESDIAALLDAAKNPSHGPEPSTSSALGGRPSIVDRGLLSGVEAERLVAVFQRGFVHKFPFVLTPPDETAARLREREPFLFLCVLSATMGSAHPLRKIIIEEIMEHVTLRVVARSERNLELLRGMLVHSAWYSYPAEKYNPRLLLLIQLCVSTLYDLGLHKKPSPTADEQRALLGTYWLLVSVYTSVGRPIIVKHDGRTDERIQSIASTEHLSDRWIAPFVHLQSFLATVDEVYGSMQKSGGRVLVQVTRDTLQRQFDSVRASVEKDLSGCPSSTENAIRTDTKFVEMRLEELSLRDELWTEEPASAVRTTMLMGLIQRSKELIYMTRNMPVSEIAQMTVASSAHVCAAISYIPTAVFTLLKLITGSTDSAMEAQVQAVVDAAEYPKFVTELANVLETRFEGMSAADKETDTLASVCSKMRLLARAYPYQIREIVGTAPSGDARRDMSSIMAVHANEVITTPPSIYGDLGDPLFPIDDIQWDSLFSNFTSYS